MRLFFEYFGKTQTEQKKDVKQGTQRYAKALLYKCFLSPQIKDKTSSNFFVYFSIIFFFITVDWWSAEINLFPNICPISYQWKCNDRHLRRTPDSVFLMILLSIQLLWMLLYHLHGEKTFNWLSISTFEKKQANE